MKVKIISEYGLAESMLGLSLSFNRDVSDMYGVAKRLYAKDGGHNKFLEFLIVYLDITAPRYWWSQFDAYRIGISKQSESTMHTITRRKLTQDDFEDNIPEVMLDTLNELIDGKNTIMVKSLLAESFLQRRIVVTNYKTLRAMVAQRMTHRLPQWRKFINTVLSSVKHREFFSDLAERNDRVMR
jgi:hypothetical protein